MTRTRSPGRSHFWKAAWTSAPFRLAYRLAAMLGKVATHRVDRPSVEQIPFVLLIPHHAWWTGMFNPPPRTSEVYCDITTPARWEGDTVHIIDLDLDVVRRRETGLVELRDEDEFDQHRVQFGYPDDLVAEARTAAGRLLTALGNGSEPFAGQYHKYLLQVA